MLLIKTLPALRVSLGYKANLSENFTTRVNLSTGFRAPNLAELTSNGVHHGTNRFEIGNNDLSKENNTQIDVSFEYKNKHIEFYVNGFYNKINDYIFLTPRGDFEDGNPVFTYVQEDAKLYGGEIGFHFHPHPVDWLHIESNYETVIGKQDNGNYLPLIPANTLNNTIRSEFDIANWMDNGYASIHLQTAFDQDNAGIFETRTGGYSLINLGIGGNIALGSLKFSTNLNINNLFNKEYINHLSRLKTDGLLNMGRNIVLGVNFEI